MENVKQQDRQQPKESQATQEDIWTSAFDSKSGASAPPPPFQLKTSNLNPEAGTVQRQTTGAGSGPKDIVSPTQVANDAKVIHDVCWSLMGDGADVVAVLRGKSVGHLKALRRYFEAVYGIVLETLLDRCLNATNYAAAMVYLRPAMTLMDRLRNQKSLLDDNEEAMVYLIEHATPDEIALSRSQGVRKFLFDELNGMQLYESHKRIFPPAEFPDAHWNMALKVIAAAEGWLMDDEDHVYKVILDLTPAQRKFLWMNHEKRLSFLNADLDKIKQICLGTEATVLKTTMDIATDGGGTYDGLVEKTVAAAEAKVSRKAELEAKLKAGDQSVIPELKQIGAVDALVKPKYVDGGIDPDSFLGDLEGDLSEGEYLKYAQTLGVSQFDTAKRMILNAVGTFQDDIGEMKKAFEMILNAQLRRKLWADADVQAAFRASMGYAEQLTLVPYRDGDTYLIAEDKFLEIVDTFIIWDSTYTDLIELLTTISDVDRKALVEKYADKLAKFTDQSTGHKHLAMAVDAAVKDGVVSLDLTLEAASIGAGTSDELIEHKLDALDDMEYFSLRMGYALVHGFQIPETLIPLGMQQVARHRYQQLMETLQGEMGFDQIQTTSDLFLKAPSIIEMTQPGGIEMSMFILQQRVKDKIGAREDGFTSDPLGWLATNFIDVFSNSGGVADVAAVETLSLYYQTLQDGGASDLDFAAMAASYEQFSGAYEEHVAACDSVASVASTVAAIAVAIVVVVASSGTATGPAIAGLAAYLGSTTAATAVVAAAAAGTYKVAASELIGQEHYSVADEGARDFTIGAVDGALTAVTAGIAKSLQLAFMPIVHAGAETAAAEVVAGTIRAAESGLSFIGKEAAIHGIRGTIDGVISGAVGNLVLTATDEATWRKGIWDTISTFGMSLAQGALMGGVTGGIMQGGIGAAAAKSAANKVGKLAEFARKARIDPADFDQLGIAEVQGLNRVLGQFSPDEAAQLWTTLKLHGIQDQIGTIVDDFFSKGKWMVDENAEVLGLWQRFRYTNAEGKELMGHIELVREGDRVGLRAVVPYDGFGGKVILDPHRTTTVLGRSVEAALHPEGFAGAMNLPIGTNYFRFQGNFAVGMNKGGGNVLDIADWSWAKNNAWLQASLDRGDIIRFVSDPTDLRNLYYNGFDASGGLTITGEELGVLMNRGYAPDPKTGIVRKIEEIGEENIPKDWNKVKETVYANDRLTEIDKDAYDRFLYESQGTDRSLKMDKEKDTGRIKSIQTNTFGGNANIPKYSK